MSTPSLYGHLETIYELHELRERATRLRDDGYAALRGIERIDRLVDKTVAITPAGPYKRWIVMGNGLETALLLQVQRNARLKARGVASLAPECEERLRFTRIEDLFPHDDASGATENDSNDLLDKRLPVLLAALSLQISARRSSTALSTSSMLCYYRILVELNAALQPDWIIGGARAGEGANVSAFVTSECMRAVLTLDRALTRTIDFIDHTRVLNQRYLLFMSMLHSTGMTGDEQHHPLSEWVEHVIERVWLDWYIATDSQRIGIALDISRELESGSPLQAVGNWLRAFTGQLNNALKAAVTNIEIAIESVSSYELMAREAEDRQIAEDQETASIQANRSARQYGRLVIDRALDHAKRLHDFAAKYQEETSDIDQLLVELRGEFQQISRQMHRVLDSSKRFVESVMDRALAGADQSQADAGELVFAAVAFGAATGWRPGNEELQRVCELLLKSIPTGGLLVTRKPFHSTRRGYKLFATGCDMARALALLLENTSYAFAPDAIRRLIDGIDAKKIVHTEQSGIGWNFDGATELDKSSVWVTSVTVLALDRIVRTLDARINSLVLRNFDVIFQEKPHTELTLNDLIYPDYGFARGYAREDSHRIPMAIRLEHMRAQLLRVSVPSGMRSKSGRKPPFSAVLYGPPQTGKTTWAEALAFSSGVPLVSCHA